MLSIFTLPFKILRHLAHGLVAGALLYAIATQWCGDIAGVELLAHFRVYALFGCLLGSLLFLFGLSLGRVVLGLLVCVWLAWPMAPYYFPPKSAHPQTGQTKKPTHESPNAAPEIKLALFNVLHKNTNPQLMEQILAWDADVVLLLETSTSFYRSHYQRVRDAYPNHYVAPADGAFGLWCFTRLPLAKDLCKTRSKAVGTPACDWSLKLSDGSQARLLVIHPPPPLDGKAMAARRQALSAAALPLASEHGPAILAGDLNCTPYSNLFGTLLGSTRLRDSAWGHGITTTWRPAPLCGLAIDHVLVSTHWQVISRSIGPDLGSDHRPVLLTLRKIQD